MPLFILQYSQGREHWGESGVFGSYLKNPVSLEDMVTQLRNAIITKPQTVYTNRYYLYRIIDRKTDQVLKPAFYLKDLVVEKFEIET